MKPWTFSYAGLYLTALELVEKSFVLGVRALEFTLGIICDDTLALGILTDAIALSAFTSAVPIIAKLSEKYNIGPHESFNWNGLLGTSGSLSFGHIGLFLGDGRQKYCLSTQ